MPCFVIPFVWLFCTVAIFGNEGVTHWSFDLSEIDVLKGKEIETANPFMLEGETAPDQDRFEQLKIDLSLALKQDTGFVVREVVWDKKDLCATAWITDKEGNEIPVTARLKSNRKRENGITIQLSKTRHEKIARFEVSEQAFSRSAREVVADMKSLISLRKKLGFDEPSEVFDRVARKIANDVDSLTEEDSLLLRSAMQEIVDALKEDKETDMKAAREELSWINSARETKARRIRQIMNKNTPKQQYEKTLIRNLTLEIQGLKTRRERMERAIDRLPRVLKSDLSRLENRYERFRELRTEYGALKFYEKEKEAVLSVISNLEKTGVVVEVRLVAE